MFLKKAGKLLFPTFAALAFVLSISAQQVSVEYGQPDELRGVNKIFVDTGLDSQRREQIVKTIKKRLPDLEIVSRPEESNFHLRFSEKNDQDETIGTIVKIISENRVRVLFGFKDVPLTFASDTLSDFAMQYAKPTIFAAQFVKLYKKANNES